MSSQADESQGFVLGVVFGVIALVLALVIGLTIHQTNKRQAAKPVAVAATVGAADAASVVVENGVVKFYFASGKADLAVGAKEALAAVVAGASTGKKVVISGFHDATGSAEVNAELAKLRAMAVRSDLLQSGVVQDLIELKKPEQTLATVSNAEARRVEVTLQ
jgi:outer membrane protein OmpA-like peptidoglycan-associated protein